LPNLKDKRHKRRSSKNLYGLKRAVGITSVAAPTGQRAAPAGVSQLKNVVFG
jgi:hypothetical protein